MKKRLVVSTTNDISTDNRVHKVCMLLLELGYDVFWIGRKLPESLPLKRPYQTLRMHLFFKKGALFYAEYNLRLFLKLLFVKTDVLLSNDLDTLLANFIASKIRNKTIVYDTHEYFLGVPEIQKRSLVKGVWQKIEQWIFPKLEHIFTVNNSIAALYKNDYGKDLMVFRNISDPPKIEKWKTRAELRLPKDAFIFINQGSGMNIDRGLEEALEAIAYIDGALLLLVGSGDAIPGLKEMVKQKGLHKRVIFVDKVPYEELLQYTHASNCGLSLDKNTNINYKYSLPNKLFDYFFCEIPVIVSPVVEVKNIVEATQTGIVVEDVTPKNIEKTMRQMMELPSGTFYENLKKTNEDFNWQNEQLVLKNFYRSLLIEL